ncbi:helix-turn-helix transcriptional regulator [Rhodococcus sp. KBS0724]|nr:helix-turn-helix transcriptional regulator [Rhodococcus sp. KBS0724]
MRLLPATDIFAYDAASINEILAGTGNSKGSLCHHFPSETLWRSTSYTCGAPSWSTRSAG